MLIQRPWLRQPQVAWRINRSHALARGLELCAPLHPIHGYRDLVRGALPTRTAPIDPAPYRHGMYPTFGSAALDFSTPAAIGATTPCTIAWTQEARGTSAYSSIIHIKIQGETNNFLIGQSSSDATYYFYAGHRNGTANAAQFNQIGALADGVPVRHVLLVPDGLTGASTNCVLYRNAERLTPSGLFNLGTDAASGGVRVGLELGGANPWEGAIGDIHMWSRLLNHSEALAWCSNPWSVAEPLPRRMWAPSVATGIPVLSAATVAAITSTTATPRVTVTFS